MLKLNLENGVSSYRMFGVHDFLIHKKKLVPTKENHKWAGYSFILFQNDVICEELESMIDGIPERKTVLLRDNLSDEIKTVACTAEECTKKNFLMCLGESRKYGSVVVAYHKDHDISYVLNGTRSS